MNNKHYFKKSFVLLMEAGVLTFGLGSCANMSDTTKTYAQATGIGAAGGAGVGALAGHAADAGRGWPGRRGCRAGP